MEIELLKRDWLKLGEKYFEDINFEKKIGKQIIKKYSEKNRYYHNLNHISSMLDLADENQSEIVNYDEVLFAIWFHDIIYKATSKKNEEKSADFANSTLKEGLKIELDINKVYNLIISTKKHQILLDENNDNAFLLDFDLSILAANWNEYEYYIQNIRKEYKIYPYFVYNPARKKVLESFVKREQLYFTKKYQELFEVKARQNLAREIKLLS